MVSEDAQPDETAEEVVSPAQHAAGSLTTVNEGALDAVSTVDHLDEQLEAMYAEYKQRVGKRALARLAAEENKGGRRRDLQICKAHGSCGAGDGRRCGSRGAGETSGGG